MLVKHLLEEHPFSALFGENIIAWKTFFVTLSIFEDTDGMIMYGVQDIGEKAAKKCFGELMAVVKWHIIHVCFDSGTNYEVISNSIKTWPANNSQYNQAFQRSSKTTIHHLTYFET